MQAIRGWARIRCIDQSVTRPVSQSLLGCRQRIYDRAAKSGVVHYPIQAEPRMSLCEQAHVHSKPWPGRAVLSPRRGVAALDDLGGVAAGRRDARSRRRAEAMAERFSSASRCKPTTATGCNTALYPSTRDEGMARRCHRETAMTARAVAPDPTVLAAQALSLPRRRSCRCSTAPDIA
jgi:hypothetical protein